MCIRDSTGVPASSSAAIASVSWISPPLPGLVSAIASKILPGRTYRPTTARLLGASLGDGFSTRPVTSTTPSPRSDSRTEAIP